MTKERILQALRGKDQSQEKLIDAVKAQLNNKRKESEGVWGRPESPQGKVS